MRKFQKLISISLVFLFFLLTFGFNHQIKATETRNIALNKTVVASAEHQSMPASKAVDGLINLQDRHGRWSSERRAPQWIMVDLTRPASITGFKIVAENQDQKIGKFKIEGSNDVTDNKTFHEIYQSEDRASTGFDYETTFNLENAQEYRFVRLTIQKMKDGVYPSVSLREFEIYGVLDETAPSPQDPNENIARGQTARSSGNEAASLSADKLTDGDKTSRSSRWSSNIADAPHWVYIDLGSIKDIKTINLFWEARKATNYKIQLSDDANSWRDVAVFNQLPADKNQRVVLDQTQRARYVKLQIDAFNRLDPETNISWNTISLYEIEVFGGELAAPAVTIDDIANSIQARVENNRLVFTYQENSNFTVSYNGTDIEQIIDENQNVITPFVNKTVKASFKVKEIANPSNYTFKEVNVQVAGRHQIGGNTAPNVIPEIAEWSGASGFFSVSETTKVAVLNEELRKTAEIFIEDYKALTGKTLAISTSATTNDIVFKLSDDASLGLKEEGYVLNVGDNLEIIASHKTGAFWATRSILQSFMQDNNFPKGIARDYPLYKVRGFILDVGRKSFTMKELRQITKLMAWYKMNDFHVHLNDNLIPLEMYSRQGKNPLDAYSAFRLESDIKEGGNGGLNKYDLTAKDVFYTKEEFRNFIKESREMGVNIVPEIDTPAHSLALTKVRPDLRHGDFGRDNDHLNLVTKYDESLAFVKEIFDEYLTGENPVFDEKTIVHIGADEYTANGNAYRRFSNDMLRHIKESGRKARIWGSLTRIRGDVQVPGEGYEMNLWNGGWANMKEMYDLGFDLINANDGHYYIVPNAGYYYDYLNDNILYNLDVNRIGDNFVPAGDKQMLGASFAVWNDVIDVLDAGISEYDVYVRIKKPMALFGAKLWGKNTDSIDNARTKQRNLEAVPNTNFNYEVSKQDDKVFHYPLANNNDVSNNNRHLTALTNASYEMIDGMMALRLNGNESYASTPLETVGLNHSLVFKVKRLSDSLDEQVLFESPYGEIKAVQKGTGKVGFTREIFNYSFDYVLPVNQWVELEIQNDFEVARLYVDGQLVDTIGDDERIFNRRLKATTMLPVAYIGSKSKAFDGYIGDLKLANRNSFKTTINLDRLLERINSLNINHPELANAKADALRVKSSFNPTQEEIDAVVLKLTEILNSSSFKVADYTKVNHYKALVPSDLSIYTDASVRRVNQVLGDIIENLPETLQKTVDAYEKALKNALDGLELKPTFDETYYDHTKITATASSNQSNNDVAAKAFDNDENTMWHTRWSTTTMPHWINAELEEPAEIKALVYVPRQSGNNNGIATRYRIEISDNGTDYRTIKTGDLANDKTRKEITFDPVVTKHVKFVLVNAVNNNGSAAEIKLVRSDVIANTDELVATINNAKLIDSTLYSQASLNNLNEKLEMAKLVVDSERPGFLEVAIARKNILLAIAKLKLKEDVIVNNGNIEIEYNKDLFNNDIRLRVVTLDEAIEGYKNEDVDLYDIDIIDTTTNEKVNFNGSVKVKIEFDKNKTPIKVYYVGEQLEQLDYKVIRENTKAYVEFEATHFSKYAIIFKPTATSDNTTTIVIDNNKPKPDVVVVNTVNPTVINNTPKLPNTGSNNNYQNLALVMFIIGAYLLKKKY